MPVVTKETRSLRPDCPNAGMMKILLNHALPRDLDDAWWQDLFEIFTYPTEIKMPKAVLSIDSSNLKFYVVNSWVDEWPNDWWECLFETFTFPEYQK